MKKNKIQDMKEQFQLLKDIKFFELVSYPKKENIPIKEQKLKRERIKRQNLYRKPRNKK